MALLLISAAAGYRFFTGLIDDVHIYDELLNADAIYAIYDMKKALYLSQRR